MIKIKLPFNGVKIDLFLLILVLLAFLTGLLMHLLIIILLIVVHELGHYFVAKQFKWPIYQMSISLFGGVIETDVANQRPLLEDLIVTIAGPLQHVFIYFLMQLISSYSLFNEQLIELFLFYNIALFIFNLLPIYPLDGGRLLFIILSLLIPVKKAHLLTIYISMFTLSLAIFIVASLQFVSVIVFYLIIFLFYYLYSERKNHFFIFYRYLISRYQSARTYKRQAIIKVKSNATMLDLAQLIRREQLSVYYCVEYPKHLISEKKCLHVLLNNHHQIQLSELLK